MQTRHQHTPRRCTHRTARVMLCKFHTPACQAIDMGRQKLILPITAHITVPQIISQDVYNIRMPGLLTYESFYPTAAQLRRSCSGYCCWLYKNS